MGWHRPFGNINRYVNISWSHNNLFLKIAGCRRGRTYIVGKCDRDYRGQWPIGLDDEEGKALKRAPNYKSDGSSPKYRLFSTRDVREVEPKLAYHCKEIRILFLKGCEMFTFSVQLEGLDSESRMNRFLISIHPDPDYQLLLAEYSYGNCLHEGVLQSLSDSSRHTDYNCFKYLISRQGHQQEGGWKKHQSIPFVWRTPQCGCFVIK